MKVFLYFWLTLVALLAPVNVLADQASASSNSTVVYNDSLTPSTKQFLNGWSCDYIPTSEMKPYSEDTSSNMNLNPFFDFLGSCAKLLLYLGIGALILLLVFLLYNLISRFSNDGGADNEILKDGTNGYESDSIFDHNFQKEIDDLVKKGDFKGAVRIVYLYVLFSLNKANLIAWAESKAPTEYYYELKRASLKPSLFSLTTTFLAVRYGNASITAEDFYKVNEQGLSIVKIVSSNIS